MQTSCFDGCALQVQHALAADYATGSSIIALARSYNCALKMPATGPGGDRISDGLYGRHECINAPAPLSVRLRGAVVASRPTPHECITASRCSSQHTAGLHQQPRSLRLGRVKIIATLSGRSRANQPRLSDYWPAINPAAVAQPYANAIPLRSMTRRYSPTQTAKACSSPTFFQPHAEPAVNRGGDPFAID